MAKGLRCLITSRAAIIRIQAQFNQIANMMLAANPTVKITAKELYNQARANNVDIDLESVASIYAETFASSIGVHSNFETEAELQAYQKKTVPLKSEVKEALIKGGFGKDQKNGTQILDWVKLMRKSESEIRNEVVQAIVDSFPAGTDPNTITAEVDAAVEALKGNWKQILSNALIKAQNDLRNRNDRVTVNQKNSIDKLSDLWAEGLFDAFKDDFANATRRAVGVSNTNITAMAKLDDLAKTANLLANSPYGTNNILAQQVESQANDIIAQARYEDAPFIYKAMKTLSSIFEFVLLKTLNNPFNRTQNFFSGKVGLLNSRVNYGSNDSNIKELAKATKRDIIRNGGLDFGDVNNMFTGNRSAVDRVRKKITEFITGTDPSNASRLSNWMFNQIMGTASLNAVDSYNKVLNTWGRFADGMEQILISKGHTKQEAQQLLHAEIFGKDKWKDAQVKASDVIDNINSRGGNILKNDSTIKRFAADIIKLELVQNGLISADQLDASWKAGYKAAGREMGHVPNNILSSSLNSLKTDAAERINKAVDAKDYTKAASLMLYDIVANKIIFRFAGGGTNWIFLKLEKGGLGIVRGGLSRIVNSKSFNQRETLSSLSPKEIEDNLYDVQRTKDAIARGTVGLISNSALLLLAMYVIKRGDDEERRKKQLVEFMSKHYVVQKAVDAVIPWYLSAYLAKMQQDNVGWDKLDNVYKKQPIVDYTLKFANQSRDFSFVSQFGNTLKATSNDEEKQLKGYEAMGKMIGNYLDVNPLPTKIVYDGTNIYKEITGNTEYVPPKYDDNGEAFFRGIFKYGIVDKMIPNK